MQNKLNTIKKKLLSQIEASAQSGDIDTVTRLSSSLSKVQELIIASERIEEETDKLESAMNEKNPLKYITSHNKPSSTPSSRSPKSQIQIEIDWGKNGQPFGKEVIHEHTAAYTMAKLMHRLHEILGDRALLVASELKVNRGPLVSKNPEKDYINRNTGKPFQSKEIDGTKYKVLTHSENDEKIDQVMGLLRALNLTPGSYKAIKVTPEDRLKEKYLRTK